MARTAGVQLRRAQLADADSIALLHIASWRVAYSAELPAPYLASLDGAARAEQWRTRMARPTTDVLLAEQDGVLLGFCAHGPAHDLGGSLTSAWGRSNRRCLQNARTGGQELERPWEIYSLHVQPQLRGGGIGTILFNEGLGSAHRAGASLLTLWVVATNAPARRFYEGKGMQPDGAAKNRELAPGITLHEVRYSVALLTASGAR
jgi:ribosomal protein S18 acetylase RimI-like enzyme